MLFVSKAFDLEPVPVFNLEVEECHTYFVGDERGNSVLVHNQYGAPTTQPSIELPRFSVPSDPDAFKREWKKPKEPIEQPVPGPQGSPNVKDQLQSAEGRAREQMDIDGIVPNPVNPPSNVLDLGPLGKFNNQYEFGGKVYNALRGLFGLPELQSAPPVMPGTKEAMQQPVHPDAKGTPAPAPIHQDAGLHGNTLVIPFQPWSKTVDDLSQQFKRLIPFYKPK